MESPSYTRLIYDGVYPLAVWAGEVKRLRLWLGAMVFSLILGLGNFYGGTRLGYVDDQMLSYRSTGYARFSRRSLSHPLRLSIGGKSSVLLSESGQTASGPSQMDCS